MLRSLFAIPLLVSAQTAAIPQTLPTQQILEPVPLVDCDDGAGSAFRIGPGLLLSVNHVTKIGGCMIDGEPIHVIYYSPDADFSILSDNREGHWLKVDCTGFVEGKTYVAVGHARDQDALTIVPMIATGQTVDGLYVLAGLMEAQPGMSGGAVLDAETGKVVGTVNAANWEEGTTFSVELKGTPICGGKA